MGQLLQEEDALQGDHCWQEQGQVPQGDERPIHGVAEMG